MEGNRPGRQSLVRWLPLGEETEWLSRRIARLFLRANEGFGFDLAGFAEPMHVIEYGNSDHIDWHADCGPRWASTRKLVATIALTSPDAYRGGELTFAGLCGPIESEGIGDALVFPAFLNHMVTPVTSGKRCVLLAWAHGPAFR